MNERPPDRMQRSRPEPFFPGSVGREIKSPQKLRTVVHCYRLSADRQHHLFRVGNFLRDPHLFLEFSAQQPANGLEKLRRTRTLHDSHPEGVEVIGSRLSDRGKQQSSAFG